MPVTDFWNNVFSKGQDNPYSRVEMPDPNDPILQRALRHFGSVENKTLIDLGCGRGAASLFFASRGAKVISVDLSEVAVKNLFNYCQENGIENVFPKAMSAHEIANLDKADFVFGSMILHHIEPFHEFARILRATVKQEGKAFFWENNARSKTMIWFRQHVVGKLWVPKYGDPDEFPLTTGEINEIRKHFQVTLEFPELVFFRMISSYLLRGRLRSQFEGLDNYFYKYPPIREYSYYQYLCLN